MLTITSDDEDRNELHAWQSNWRDTIVNIDVTHDGDDHTVSLSREHVKQLRDYLTFMLDMLDDDEEAHRVPG
jgi:hypothetical protein